MSNYISKKNFKEAYKKMEEEPFFLPPKAYQELQKIILENKQLKSILNELEEWLKSHLDDEYYWSKIYWYLENLKEKYK